MNKLTYLLVATAFVAMIAVGALWTNARAGAGCGGCSDDAAAVTPTMMMDGTPPTTKPATQPTTKPAPAFANLRCPIMGTTIVPAKVTPDLTREYKGQKVAFCCGMCPPAWDKLTDAEKDAKLKAAGEAKPATGGEHQH